MAGGVVPIVLAVVLFKVLPESPRYLAGRRDAVAGADGAAAPDGTPVPDDVSYVEARGRRRCPSGRASATCSRRQYLRDTSRSSPSFFFCLMVNYIAILLIPVTVHRRGFRRPTRLVCSVFNLGGVAGAIVGALVIQRLGSRIAMLGMSAVAVAASLVLAGMPLARRRRLL